MVERPREECLYKKNKFVKTNKQLLISNRRGKTPKSGQSRTCKLK